MASNRKTIRKAFADLLETALSSLAQTVYDYRVGDFAGATPVVVVSSGGSLRTRATYQGSKAQMFLQVDVFVLYSDGGSWGEDDAEDAVDDIEAAIAGVIDANQATANWFSLTPGERSQRLDVTVGGVDYIRESITVVVGTWG